MEKLSELWRVEAQRRKAQQDMVLQRQQAEEQRQAELARIEREQRAALFIGEHLQVWIDEVQELVLQAADIGAFHVVYKKQTDTKAQAPFVQLTMQQLAEYFEKEQGLYTKITAGNNSRAYQAGGDGLYDSQTGYTEPTQFWTEVLLSYDKSVITYEKLWRK